MALNFSFGSREMVLSGATRKALGLKNWPDTVMGVMRNCSSYHFFAGSGTKLSKTIGSLDNPVSGGVTTQIGIKNLKFPYNYRGGGPVYRDPASGMLLMFYHAEIWLNPREPLPFYSLLGMARSLNDGSTWTDLGEIIRPHVTFVDAKAVGRGHEIGSGSFLVTDGGYFYVYFNEWQTLDKGYLAVARAKVADVVSAAGDQSAVVTWQKWYKAAWKQPGLGGSGASLGFSIFTSCVSFNTFLGKYLMFAAKWDEDIYYSTSTDGIVWSSLIKVLDESQKVRYPTLIGTGSEPRDTGAAFYVYYKYADNGDYSGRHKAMYLARRLVSVG